jgi:hypothetical protein
MGMSKQSKEEEYRGHAMTMLELAQRQPVDAERSRLMALAEAWLDLAERAARSPVERLRRAVERNGTTQQRPDAE